MGPETAFASRVTAPVEVAVDLDFCGRPFVEKSSR
jgi:hypothetical protein